MCQLFLYNLYSIWQYFPGKLYPISNSSFRLGEAISRAGYKQQMSLVLSLMLLKALSHGVSGVSCNCSSRRSHGQWGSSGSHLGKVKSFLLFRCYRYSCTISVFNYLTIFTLSASSYHIVDIREWNKLPDKDQTTDEHQCDKCLDAIILDISIVLFNPS